MTPPSMPPEVCPARTEPRLPEVPALGAGLTTPPSMRPEVCRARTEPRPPDTGRPPEERPAAYVVRCACAPGLDGTKGGTVVDHVRLFRLRPGVRWTYRVHEQILPSLKRAKIPVRWTDVIVQHKGYAAPAVEARKLELLPWSKLAAPLFHSLVVDMVKAPRLNQAIRAGDRPPATTNSSRCGADPSQGRTQKWPGERISRPLFVSVRAMVFLARRRCGLPFGWSLGTRPAGNPTTPEAIRLAHCQVVSARGDRGGTEDRREAPGGVGG
jgi:hypothetical protein